MTTTTKLIIKRKMDLSPNSGKGQHSMTPSRESTPGLTLKTRKTSRVKSGCRTCKARKLKCDEARPVCKRCHTSGRVCEGYGIWGGGNASINEPRLRAHTPASLMLPSTAVHATPEERDLLDWFRYRTSIKFHATYGSKFWEILALRASLEEPAIFHAVLAISAVHKRIILGGEARIDVLDPGQDKLLQTYHRHRGEAVSKLLQLQGSGNSKNAVRTALVACILFTNMDFATGLYESGQTHFISGVKLLSSLKDNMPLNPASPGNYSFAEGNENADDNYLLEVFSRSHLNAAQWGLCHWRPEPLPDTFCMPLPEFFESAEQAKNALDILLSDTIKLTAHARHGGAFTDIHGSAQLQDLANRLQANVRQWPGIFERSLPSFETRLWGRGSTLGLRLMRMTYAMTLIMADVCLNPDDEMAYDSHLDNFHTIISRGQEVLQETKNIHAKGNDALRPYRETFVFIPDSGWQSPVYFTAIHCRNYRLRRHALDFLLLVPTQEFIWNHKISADMAREIINLEHGESPEGAKDQYNPMEPVRREDLAAPDVPVEQRCSNPRISVYDNPPRLVLSYGKQNQWGGSELFVQGYDLDNSGSAIRNGHPYSSTQSSLRDNPLVNYEMDQKNNNAPSETPPDGHGS